jgi:hypothetical protein
MRGLGCRPADRIATDLAAMMPLPPVAPATGWSTSLILPRDHYVRLDSNDYSIHPCVVGRRVLVHADLDRVTATCEGRTVADHPRSWARHQTFTDPDHASAATALRRTRFTLASTPTLDPGLVVQVRDLSTYDTAFGLDEGTAS